MVRSRFDDLPPFDKAVELPDSIFIEFEWGFASVTSMWRDWRKRRRDRRRVRRERRATALRRR
jgi:hypothetical protein